MYARTSCEYMNPSKGRIYERLIYIKKSYMPSKTIMFKPYTETERVLGFMRGKMFDH